MLFDTLLFYHPLYFLERISKIESDSYNKLKNGENKINVKLN